MLDLSQNLIIALIVGPGIAAAILLAGWFVRRSFHKQDEDIKNMVVTQKEIWEKLAGVLEREKERSNELKSGMEIVDLKFENMGLTFNKDLGVLAANVDKEVKALAASMDKDIQTLATNMDKEIMELRHSFSEMKVSMGARDEVVERDLAEIRERLKGDGTGPSRNNGAG